MSFFHGYIEMWKNYANFKGRTSVRDYWMAVLVNFIIGTVLGFIGIELISSLYGLAVLIPGIAVCIRRLRDAGKAWGWIFISLVPVVGFIILIVMLCKKSVPVEGEVVEVAAAE